MSSTNPKDAQGNTPNWRAIYIVDAPMDAAIATHRLACGQPVKNGTQQLSLAKKSLSFLKKTQGNYKATKGVFCFAFLAILISHLNAKSV
jgi:hypothetical protein